MSTPNVDSDALATEKMLQMFENMADSDPETAEATAVVEDMADQTKDDLDALDDLGNLSMDEELPEASDDNTLAADALELDEHSLDENTSETTHSASTPTSELPIIEHLNAVVENAIQALQDWLTIRAQSEEKHPQQRQLVQLDSLLDTVTRQQQHLASQLEKAASLDLSSLATALGTRLPTPEALGWSEDEWRSRAQQVASKTEDIVAMNTRLREQLDKL